MEPPSPSVSLKSKEYTLKSENRTFKIKICLSSEITIEINELDKIQGIFYSSTFSLEALIKLSKGFRVCEDIKEAYDIIEQIFQNEKASINTINENEISLIIKVDLPGGKIQEVNLTLNKKEMNRNTLIEELVRKVNQLEEENKVIKERLNLFEKYFADVIKYKKMIEEVGLDSKIITKKDDIEFITKRLINNDENLKQKKINYNLIYRGTRDGDSLNNFHNKVDNKNSHLSIIETIKGFKFGVFIETPFKGTKSPINDNKCFVFSLNLKKIYNAKNGANNINDCTSCIIHLYNHPICIVENYLSNNNSYTCAKSDADTSFTGFIKDYELNSDEQYFQVKELETFQIVFN